MNIIVYMKFAKVCSCRDRFILYSVDKRKNLTVTVFYEFYK